MWMVGLSINLCSLIFSGLSPTLPLLIVSRVLSGIGGAMTSTNPFLASAKSHSPSRRSRGFWTCYGRLRSRKTRHPYRYLSVFSQRLSLLTLPLLKIIGLLTTSSTISPSLGIILGGFAIEFFSWRWLFWVPYAHDSSLFSYLCIFIRRRFYLWH